MTAPEALWAKPKRILLLTYDRADHLMTSYKHSVVGVPADRGSRTRAERVRPGDWVLIRLSEFGDFRASRPAKVTARGVQQRNDSEYPDLLWESEKEQSHIIYPYRIPVTFEGGPRTMPGCVNWETLAALRLRGKDGYLLDAPQQWGIKFTTNVLDDFNDVTAFFELIVRCTV